ncbi:MAG: hypothetical protein WCF85_13725 [Rhodospirillaceae bacterium]
MAETAKNLGVSEQALPRRDRELSFRLSRNSDILGNRMHSRPVVVPK